MSDLRKIAQYAAALSGGQLLALVREAGADSGLLHPQQLDRIERSALLGDLEQIRQYETAEAPAEQPRTLAA